MSITTRTGDAGETGLLNGERIRKSSPRLEAYGTLDELNAVIGIALAEPEVPAGIGACLQEVQRLLFCMGTDLATPHESKAKIDRLGQDAIAKIDAWILELEQALPLLQCFILPAGSRLAALLHQARTVCRRAERRSIALAESERINPHVHICLNRMSDYLFLAARAANQAMNIEDIKM